MALIQPLFLVNLALWRGPHRLYHRGYGFPPSKGGPMFDAENYVGFQKHPGVVAAGLDSGAL